MKKFNKYFALLIICIIGFSSCEEPNDPALPYQPSESKVIGKTITSIDVFWPEATIDNFDRYDVYYKKYYESDYKLYMSITNQQQLYVSVSGLTPDMEYKIYINTVDKSGKILTSKELVEKTFSDIPSSFDILRVSNYSFSTATLLWSIYKDSYAVPFDRYELYMGSSSDFICNDSTRVLVYRNMDFIEGTVGNLKDKQSYYFKVRVYNTLEKFRESSPAYLKTPNAPPLPVQLFDAENITGTSALLRWKKSNDEEFDKYTIHMGDNEAFAPSSKNLMVTIWNSKDTTLNVTGLKLGAGYVFKVVVYDKYLDYAISNYVGFDSYPDGIPPVIEISNMYAYPQKSEIEVHWNRSDIIMYSRYDIYKSTDSMDLVRGGGIDSSVTDQKRTYYYTSNLQRQKTYYFKVAIVNIFGKQAFSSIKGIYLP